MLGKWTPGSLDTALKGYMMLPCGHCGGCRLDRSRDWAVRSVHEAQTQEESCFVTLTYDSNHLPRHGNLVPEHLQEFWRSLRRTLCDCPIPNGARHPLCVRPERHRIRYLACGEYGERRSRPHYHFALFGRDFAESRVRTGTSRDGHPLYECSEIGDSWPFGRHWIGELTFESAQYVASYITKKVTGSDEAKRKAYERVCTGCGEVYSLIPEFSTMSKKPGLGQAWIEKYWKSVYPHDEVIVKGKKYKPPRYYDKWIAAKDPELFAAVQTKRQETAEQMAAHSTPDRLAAREQVHKRRMSRYKRNTKL